MKTVIGIDVGGSTTKIVGFKYNNEGKRELVPPQYVRATDPVTSIYGAFGKFTLENGLKLDKIDKVIALIEIMFPNDKSEELQTINKDIAEFIQLANVFKK